MNATPAAAQTPVWSATLTVKDHGAEPGHTVGCRNVITGSECSTTSVLSDDDFTFGSPSVTYAITSINRVASTNFVTVAFDRSVTTALDSLKFCVGSTGLAFSSATHPAFDEYASWSTTAFSWSVGDTVSLSIVGSSASCPTPTTPATPAQTAELGAIVPGAEGGVPSISVSYRPVSSSYIQIIKSSETEPGNTWPAPYPACSGRTLPGGVAEVRTENTFTPGVKRVIFKGFDKGIWYSVRTCNGSVVSPQLSPVTTWDVPGPPKDEKVVGSNKDGICVRWAPPDNNGGEGASITGYDLQFRESLVSDSEGASHPGDGWVTVPVFGTSTSEDILRSQEILRHKGDIEYGEFDRMYGVFEGLYEVRVRAKNGIDPGSEWVTMNNVHVSGQGTGTCADAGTPPAQTPPDQTPPARTPTTGGGSGSPSGGGGGGPPAQSSDASLNTLEVGEESLDLDPDTDTYPVNAYGEESITLTPTASDRGARITVNGERVRSGRPHTVTLDDDGVTVIEIAVTAEDGTTRRTYTLTVMSCPGEERKILEMFYHSTQGDMWEQSGGWNTDADLDDWHGVRTDESGRVRSLRFPDNRLSGDIPSALLCFEGLPGLLELALWDNEGLSGEVPGDLVPAVERAVLRDVAEAEALNLNPGWFDDYDVADPFDFSDWHEGVTTDDDGRVTELDFTGEDIKGEIPGSVFELKRLTVIERECGVTLEVEAPGRVSVTPLPEGCSDASLRNIEISPGELEFDPMNRSYEVPVGYGPESVTVTPTASESEAVITVNGETVQSGTPYTVALEDDGETAIDVVVTAEDRTTTRTYEITVTRCGEDDIWALSRFYEAVGGQNWNDNTNWNSQEPLDRWFGVGTDEDGRVISLHLEGNGLSGEVPRELVCLSELKELALWDNELSGEVPEELALAVEKAVLRDVAEALNLNPGWFDDYGEPFDFENWHEGVTTDDEGRVTELDFTGEDITGEIPGSVFELQRLAVIEMGCGVTLEAEAPGRVNVMMADDCVEETVSSGGGGCALGRGDSSVSGFGLFLVTLLVFAALGRKKCV